MISICIPCYEMYGKGVKYLSVLIESIEKQTYKDVEVVISDHSQNDDIEKFCSSKEFIRYFRLSDNIGSSSANANNAIRNSTGDIIKVMFQDDYMYSEQCLEKISQTKCAWGAVGFNHIDNNNVHRNMIPKYNDNIIKGVNTFGCPSVMFFRDKKYFDENLIWLMDCEFYYRLFKQYGCPYIINDILVTIRIGDHTVSNHVDETTKKNEDLYVSGKYNI